MKYSNMIGNIVFYIGLTFVVLLCLKIYNEYDTFNLKCIISTKDGNKYCVRDRTKINEAADLLAEVTDKCKTLIKKLYDKYPNDERVIRLYNNFRPDKITETLPNSTLTAFSENKGQKISLCLNQNKYDNSKLIDKDTLFFVACHELSHICTKSIGHKQEFWNNFKFLLQEAKNFNLYIPVDYKKYPQPYCGMEIKDNPYYDL